jgi:hypothetical protein
MVKVISFSLWGNNETYTKGAIINAELANIFFPDFECWVYLHKESVPNEIIDELGEMKNVKVIIKTGDLTNEVCKPRMWRFEAIDDPNVEIMMSRDTDTRILPREKLAVDEWLKSDKNFHIMRDHPHHFYKILAGMFGSRKIPEIICWKDEINKFIKTNNKMYDQDFLREIIYPHIKNDAVVHATFSKFEPQSKDFPIKYDSEYRFVGEYVYSDESRSQSHIDILLDELKKIQ